MTDITDLITRLEGGYRRGFEMKKRPSLPPELDIELNSSLKAYNQAIKRGDEQQINDAYGRLKRANDAALRSRQSTEGVK